MFKKKTNMPEKDVHLVKSLICQGFSQVEVARAVGISASHVSRICAGDVHRDIPWPNPDIGMELMRDRREEEQVAPAVGRGLDALAARSLAAPAVYTAVDQAKETQQSMEEEAIEAARQQAIKRELMSKEIHRRADIIEKEMDAQFLKDMTITEGEPDQTDPKKMPTAWEVSFIPWKLVVKRAGENDIIKAADDEPDEIVQRAIGIVFHKMPEETWEAEGTLNLIRLVVKQLEETKK